MSIASLNQNQDPATIVAVMLNGGKVTSGFRSSLFSAAARAGVSVNEFVIKAAAEKLVACGSEFPGVFEKGDLATLSIPQLLTEN